ERQVEIVERVRDEQRNDLLGELRRAEDVRAIRDRHGQPVRLVIRADRVVGRRLRRVVRRAWPVRRVLGEHLVAVEREIAVDLARRYMVKALEALSASSRLQQRLRAEGVRPEEQARIDDGEAVVRLGREVDDDLDALRLQQPLAPLEVPDVSFDEDNPVLDPGERPAIAGVRQQVEDDEVVVRVPLEPVMDEVRADEARPACDEKSHRGMTLARGAEIRFTNMTLLASPSIRMPVRALSLALAVALIAAGPAAASGSDLQPVCAAGCVAAKPGTGALFLFSGHGWGHGIGMSQYGAWGYALHGYGYQQILSHYYPGTTLGSTTTTTVRVLLADGRKSLKLSSTAPFTVTDGNGVAHSLPAGSVSFGAALHLGATGTLPAPLTFAASSGAAMTLTRPYRGQIQVDVVNGRLRAINVVGLEDYLYGVVPAEMPSTWSPPALQAQAVAARSYALATRKIAAPFDVYADTRSQVYLGISHETPAG